MQTSLALFAPHLRLPRPAGRHRREPARPVPLPRSPRRRAVRRTSRSPTPARAARSTASTWTSAPARRSRSSARPAPARPRSATWSPACTTRTAGSRDDRRRRRPRPAPGRPGRSVGVVSQEAYLLHASIADNLRFARPGRHRRRARGGRPGRADPRPDRVAAGGLRHGGRGARLPVLRRREAAAGDRPDVLRNPPVLVLDEATSALDTRTERSVHREYFAAFLSGWEEACGGVLASNTFHCLPVQTGVASCIA